VVLDAIGCIKCEWEKGRNIVQEAIRQADEVQVPQTEAKTTTRYDVPFCMDP
jgi:hypothetical protein